jgi:polysaccharide biosynthesis protein PslF
LAKTVLAYLSTYPPRECGIATFTKDLLDAIDRKDASHVSTVIAMNETGAIYNYDKRVEWTIERNYVEDYLNTAKDLRSSNVDLVNVQHEFGLFGGDYGEYLEYFMENINKPIVTTLHTVEPNFTPKAHSILKKIVDTSDATVVITNNAINILEQQGITSKNYSVIPHGSPPIPFVNSETIKEALKMNGRFVITTFGLISRNKGIEYAIKALPAAIKKIPNLLYVIIGETHPEVRKIEGEKYRKKLMRLTYELGLEKNVRFHNRYLSKHELKEYLQATDVYINPYISPGQISSGTLTYALGAGRAVISTPYLHAQEVLADGRGLFCKFKDPNSIADCLIKLSDETLRKSIEAKAHKYSKRFLWSNIAKQYLNLFKQVIKQQK